MLVGPKVKGRTVGIEGSESRQRSPARSAAVFDSGPVATPARQLKRSSETDGAHAFGSVW
jgi:hypothetical protein